MKNLSYLSGLILVLSIGLSGCGSSNTNSGTGGSSDTNSGTGAKNGLAEYQLRTGESKKFTLSHDELILAGKICTSVGLYDDYGNKIDPVRNTLITAGNYTILLNKFSQKNGPTVGLFFYKSSGYFVPDLPLNTSVNLSERTAYLYKLVVAETSSYTTDHNSFHEYYDADLHYIYPSDPLTLTPGTYYFFASPSSCKEKGGSFKVIKL